MNIVPEEIFFPKDKILQYISLRPETVTNEAETTYYAYIPIKDDLVQKKLILKGDHVEKYLSFLFPTECMQYFIDKIHLKTLDSFVLTEIPDYTYVDKNSLRSKWINKDPDNIFQETFLFKDTPEFYITFKQVAASGLQETALCIKQPDGSIPEYKYFILNGIHFPAYLDLRNLDECVAYFKRHLYSAPSHTDIFTD
jgi:hypothetical protein